ncbi:hypothetical protein Pint_06915 [Pistacia integerrima]|uniref:Uncharacterized protein n=1 Tax=Pistacia integerrima TaxID=434235 RepID=A0ACC0XW83_9ROSI|nr:hypothetical protein Pint_06915 [Pistacia integerrima]
MPHLVRLGRRHAEMRLQNHVAGWANLKIKRGKGRRDVQMYGPPFRDVSYNNLSGSLPRWIQEQNLQLNLVANNFNLESSNYSSVLPYGLHCLQRNFPCNRGSPIYSSFAINCAGPTITSHDIVYESDNEPLGPATYYLTDTNRWGVSNVGYFIGSNNIQYNIISTSTVTNTQESRLFQRARISASSLRYYGVGLQNGKYTVTLQFVELANFTTIGWKSFGRRVFDIYVQGNLVEKDFDITRVAGGVLRRAVQRKYPAQAWHLYKNNRQLELVDSKLSEFSEEEVKVLIGVALLCTQTLPSSRPSMSRVIAMLCGDMEVSTINSKPGYLIEWAFNDVTTFVSDDINEECEDTSHYISSTRLRTTDKTLEISASEALLH